MYFQINCFFLSQILDELRRLVYTTNHAKLVRIGTSYEFNRIYGIEVNNKYVFIPRNITFSSAPERPTTF
jgi:hypothetical protein